MKIFRKALFLAPILAAFVAIACFADGPTTQPDSNGPKEAFRAFIAALGNGNKGEVGNLCVASDNQAKILVNDFENYAGAIEMLQTAVRAKFGEDAVDVVVPDLPKESDINVLQTTIQGDQAHLEGDAVGPVEMVKSDGKWKLDISAILHRADMTADPHAYFAGMTRAVKRTADDVTAGKFDSAHAASEVLKARQMAVPANEPSTLPTPTTMP